MKQWIEIWHSQKEWEGYLYENGAGKEIVGHSKLKLWIFFWSQDESEWPLVCTQPLVVNILYSYKRPNTLPLSLLLKLCNIG